MHGKPPSGARGGVACPRRRTSLATGVDRAGERLEPSTALDRARVPFAEGRGRAGGEGLRVV
ncbi:hypothetical protein WME73_16205 [Sorangium sp. So ce302]|uniref:hypothetical protein n=1 Tax=unclassified Sorangium TaxID=2621164 RepID=UPI003F6399A9